MKMRILIHDYAGHPFQISLSLELARRGHTVQHSYFLNDVGPKADFKTLNHENLKIEPLGSEIKYNKAKFIQRFLGDRNYGNMLFRSAKKFSPDVILCGNTPTQSIDIIQKKIKICLPQTKFIYWAQDLNGVAAKNILSKKFSILGYLIGNRLEQLDIKHFKNSHSIICISQSIYSYIKEKTGMVEDLQIINNWGLSDFIKPENKLNSWSSKRKIQDSFNVMYTGTLAMKHNPDILLQIASVLNNIPNSKLIICASGSGFDSLKQKIAYDPDYSNVMCENLIEYSNLPRALASADLLIALLEKDISIASVPSKILNYCCAGRPILMIGPKDNDAATMLEDNSIGWVIDQSDHNLMKQAIRKILDTDGKQHAKEARKYAETNFDIVKIANEFEKVFNGRVYDTH